MNDLHITTKQTPQPSGDRILISLDESAEQTPGGIVLPDTNKDELGVPVTGTVLAVGDGSYSDSGVLLPVRVNSGQRVVVSSYSGVNITINGEECVVVKAHDILLRV